MLWYGLPATTLLPASSQVAFPAVGLLPKASHHNYFAVYDSFDWRLYQKNLALVGDGRHLFLAHLNEATVFWPLLIDKPPVLAEQLPSSSLKKKIVPILQPRALLPQLHVFTHVSRYMLTDADEQPMAELWFVALRPSAAPEGTPFAVYACLLSNAEDQVDLSVLQQWLLGEGATAVEFSALYHHLMQQAGQQPTSYNAKPQIQLDPTAATATALLHLLQAEMSTVQTNLPYLSQDIDVEFLHDFRVALRRARSLISQFRYLLPPPASEQFRAELKEMAQWTNDLRDLDVYLLAESAYRQLLPDILQADIEPLFAYLQQKRIQVLATAVANLQSDRAQTMLRNWSRFLAQPAADDRLNEPILPVAQKQIYKQYKRILKDGRKLLKSEEEAQMHALRIQCKKLRYLLEFFATLFPAKKMATLTTQLKLLQANLGQINDLYIQELYLLRLAAELPKGGPTLLAIGALVGELHRQRTEAKAAFKKTFAQFAVSQNQQLFAKLFDAGKPNRSA